MVSISEPAFFSIIMSALEAYQVGQSSDARKDNSMVEVYGNLWGYKSQTQRNESILRVVMADADLSAKAEPSQTTPHPDAYILKTDFADCYFPEIEYLGDFHSHPYTEDEVKSELELQRNKYHRSSPADKTFVKDLQKSGRPYRLQIIATIFKRDNMVEREGGYIKDDFSCIRFRYANMTIWIKAYVFDMNGDTFRKVADKMVAILCPSAGVHVNQIEAHN
jgi:hypothetical protein